MQRLLTVDPGQPGHCMLPRETIHVWQQLGLGHILRNPANSATVQATSGKAHARLAADPRSMSDPVHSFAASLPHPLRCYHSRLTFPVRLIWTYFELDEDHRGTPDPSRVQLWDSIIKAKQWLPSDIAFWPLCLTHEAHQRAESRDANSSDCQPDDLNEQVAAAFRRLLTVFRPGYVFCFGQAAHDVLKNIYAAHPHPDDTCFLFLPGAEEMLPDNKMVKRQAWDVIRSIEI